jgi:hypothetical protein
MSVSLISAEFAVLEEGVNTAAIHVCLKSKMFGIKQTRFAMIAQWF